MVTRIRRETFTLPTSGSTVTYTIPDMQGLVPVAAKFTATLEEDSGGQDPDSSVCRGFCTVDDDYCVASFAQDADTGFSSGRVGINDRCVYLFLGDGSGSDCELSLDSFSANSVTLTVNKAASVAAFVTVTLIHCNAAEIIEFNGAPNAFPSGTFSVSIATSQMAHLVEYLFPAWAFSSASAPAVQSDGQWGFALSSYDGVTIQQGGYWRFELDGGFGGRSSNAAQLISTTRLVQQVRINSSSGNGEQRTSLWIFSQGEFFILFVTLDVSAVLTGVMLALNFGATPTVDFDIGINSTPMITGQAVIPTAAEPQWVDIMETYLTALGTPATGGTTGAFAFGGADRDGRGEVLGGRSEDNRATSSESRSWHVPVPWAMRQNGGALDIEASFVAVDGGASPGLRLDWTNVSGSARWFAYAWVEDETYVEPSTDVILRRMSGGVAIPLREIGAARALKQGDTSSPLREMGVVKEKKSGGA